MSRPRQIRAIFHELRKALGDEFSAGDLIRAAAALLEIYSSYDLEDEDQRRGPREGFFASEVDEAMKDGGWRVLDFEGRGGMSLVDEFPDNRILISQRVERLVGRTEWPRIEMVWP